MLSVIGLGNILRGDDGIGPLVVEHLQDFHHQEFAEISDVGSDPFSILEKLMANKPVLVVDCARMGLKPGSIRRIAAERADLDFSQHGVSLHGFNLAEIWEMAKAMGVEAELIIIGIQPGNLVFNTGLSNAVKNSMPSVIELVREEGKKYA